ncbi:MAG: formate dehydrogenase accessory sulfurtransferase FdhD [Chloroflexota bacterium]
MNKSADEMPISGVSPDVACHLFSEDEWLREPVPLPCEMSLAIHVNGQELVTVLCTPAKLNCLVIGYLYSEGIISGTGEVASMRICEEEPIADVRLNKEYTPPPRRTLTSGCGSGVSFNIIGQKVESDLMATPEEVLSLMKQLHDSQSLFQQCGGTHCSALCDRRQILVTAEDIGRHNTLDKILGECLLRGISTQDRILLTTGRISSEMLLKAARMQTPIIVSRGSPTERAISLGHELGITVVGYARGRRLSVFSGEWRLQAPVSKT